MIGISHLASDGRTWIDGIARVCRKRCSSFLFRPVPYFYPIMEEREREREQKEGGTNYCTNY